MEQRISGDGQIYPNKYKDAPNKPDITGEFVVNKETLKQLVSLLKDGKEPALKVAIWNRVSKAGNPYHYIKYEPVEARPKKELNGGGSSGYKANPPPTQAEDPDDPLPF